MSNVEETAIIAKDVKKKFRIPLDKTSGIKQVIVNVFKRRKGYREFNALNGVSFEIKKGEFFGIVGRNGSGKSTLLKILAGVYVPDEGGVAVNGSLTPFIELGVGFNPELSGRENVFLNGALLGFSRSEMEAMYDDIVDFAELHDFMEERLKNYSSGMQVRLAFSIAVKAESDILVLDEVLAVGDAAFQSKCYDYFQSLKEKKKTVILVTHDMDAVKRFCNRAVMIEAGQIKRIGTPAEISDIYLEDNISSAADQSGVNSIKHKFDVKIIENPNIGAQKLKIQLSYDIPDRIKHYVGISLICNGIVFAEKNSLDSLIISGGKKTTVNFSIDTASLNPGVYEVGIAVFEYGSKRLLFFRTQAAQFTLKGSDQTVGGPMKISVDWDEELQS